MATSTVNTNKPILPRGADVRPIDSYNRAALYSGKALDFDGVNDEVDVSNITDTYKSFVLLFNSDDEITSSTSVRRMFGVYSSYFGVSVGAATGLLTGETLTFLPNGSSRTATTMNFAANTWYHLAAVWNSINNNFDIYINGQNKTILSVGTASLSVVNNLKIGQTLAASTPWKGKISGFKGFTESLTAAQIADLYNFPEKIVPTGVDNTALKLWLPMMEGAGTTAYDGSGNGNHGTIAGATYVNGVGAPVAQTSVIDWNKGANLVAYSTVLIGNWSLSGGTWTSGQDDPIGGASAYKITSTGSDPWLFKNATSGISGTQYTAKCWVKGAVGREARLWIIRDNVNFESEDFTLTGNWQEIETTKTFPTTPASFVSFRLDIPNDTPGSGDVGYIFAPRLVAGDNADVYIPTLSTTQPTPVLLPQGLTTGRDITGVNLFENVRKQGALNLDGSSWAEVHDNASLDFGTGEFTLEAWLKAKYEFSGSTLNVILNLGGNASNAGAVCMLLGQTNKITAVYNNSYLDSNTILTEGEWYHVVVNFNGTHTEIYINGAFEKSVTRTAADISNALVKEIGKDSNVSRTYKDQIAQPRIYNRALTAEEVLKNYNATSSLYI